MSAKKRSYSSGAAKRKLQVLREQDAMKTRKVMENFLQRQLRQHDPQQADSETTDPCVGSPLVMRDSFDGGDAHAAIDSQAPPLIEKDKKADKYDGAAAANISGQESTSSTSGDDFVDLEEEGSGSDLHQEINTDELDEEPAVIRNRDFGDLPCEGISDELKAKIVEKGSAFFQNMDSNFFPKLKIYGKQRGLSENAFRFVLPSGEVCNRSWLLFSPRLEALFCFPCVLFTEAPNNMRSTLSEIGIGFNKFNKTERLKEHEEGIYHRKAVLKWKMEEEKLHPERDELRDMLEAELKKCEERWKEILKRVAATVRFLAKNSLSFRGHREQLDEKNPGNFLSAVKFLAEFDPVIKSHLENMKPGRVHYLSPTIQNEFIDLMGRQVEGTIVSKIKEARYFSIMVDSTPDAARQEQVSVIIRYVTNFQIRESFMGYYLIDKPDAEHYEMLVLEVLSSLGLDFSYCRGQTYDNAATMSGERSGLQKRLLNRNPKATFLNCDNHSLNLAALHAAEVDPSVLTFFETVHEVFTFFSHSPNRWTKMKTVCKRSLKMESTTRWSAREDATVALSSSLTEIMDLLESMAEAGSDEENLETRTKAGNLLSAMQRYDFFAFLAFWCRLLRLINIAQKNFQQPALNIVDAYDELQTLSAFLQDPKERENLIQESIKQAEDGSNKYGFPKTRRIRRTKRMPGEATQDAGLSIGEEFRRVAIQILDRLGMEMKDRFARLKQHVERFGFLLDLKALLQGDHTTSEYKDKLMENCSNFCAFYDELSAKALYDDVMDAKIIFGCKPLPDTSEDFLKSLAKFGKDVFFSLQVAVQLLLTLSVSVASCERSFSKLKLIKNYLRTTMSQDRLKALAILSVESEIADEVDLNDTIDEFAREKARRAI